MYIFIFFINYLTNYLPIMEFAASEQSLNANKPDSAFKIRPGAETVPKMPNAQAAESMIAVPVPGGGIVQPPTGLPQGAGLGSGGRGRGRGGAHKLPQSGFVSSFGSARGGAT